jgi:hypothetical protein
MFAEEALELPRINTARSRHGFKVEFIPPGEVFPLEVGKDCKTTGHNQFPFVFPAWLPRRTLLGVSKGPALQQARADVNFHDLLKKHGGDAHGDYR